MAIAKTAGSSAAQNEDHPPGRGERRGRLEAGPRRTSTPFAHATAATTRLPSPDSASAPVRLMGKNLTAQPGGHGCCIGDSRSRLAARAFRPSLRPTRPGGQSAAFWSRRARHVRRGCDVRRELPTRHGYRVPVARRRARHLERGLTARPGRLRSASASIALGKSRSPAAPLFPGIQIGNAFRSRGRTKEELRWAKSCTSLLLRGRHRVEEPSVGAVRRRSCSR